MHQSDQDRHAASPRKFLRVLVILWATAVLAILLGAVVAPHLGRMADFLLHQTAHRHWQSLTLQTAQPFFDLSSPEHAIKSYYSARYRGDTAIMERLTAGVFREQMRQWLAYAEASPDNVSYHSYLRTEMSGAQQAVVVEKSHLFWQRGLRFSLQRHAADWHIVGVELLQ
jgi:hypothetical protein